MEKIKKKKDSLLVPIKVGFFLAYRQIKRGSKATTALIIFVMTLTFLNLIFIGGILVGLIQGSSENNRILYTSDVIISSLEKKQYIENTPSIVEIAKNLPWTEAVTTRYVTAGVVKANYKTRVKYTDSPDESSGLIAGIDPIAEQKVTNLSSVVKEGKYLTPDDFDQVLLGADKLFQYVPINTPGLKTLHGVNVGSKVRITIGPVVKEFTVKGIVHSKVGEIDNRIFMLDTTLRGLIGRSDLSANEISIKLKNSDDSALVKQALLASGVGDRAQVQTWEEAQPKFLKDIMATFAILGNVVGSIGLVVASITIFIVIFINAITRRKFIGILRGIGVDSRAIEISYVLQSIFYASVGTIIGVVLIFMFIKPYFISHPINFPFSDGILVATPGGALIRAFALLFASLVAGYIPAKLVIRQNVLDAILGR